MAKKAPRSKRVTGPDGGTVVLRKNANGDGSVYWDASGERWRATWRPNRGPGASGPKPHSTRKPLAVG